MARPQGSGRALLAGVLLMVLVVGTISYVLYRLSHRQPSEVVTKLPPRPPERPALGTLGPDPALTPGAVFDDITEEDVCQPGYSKRVRHVPSSVKRRVYEIYGRTKEPNVCCEVDHLISLELGGSNDIKNLWPEPYQPRPGAYEKDKVENYLHRQVCAGQMTLKEAQHQIATDWYSVYRQFR